MSADPLVARWARPARTRGMVEDLALGLPPALGTAALAYRAGGPAWGGAIGLLAFGAVAALAWWRRRRFGRGWLIRALNAARPDLEDSADLLFAPPAAIGPLQRLQRARLEARLDAAQPDLRPAWPMLRVAAWWAIGMAVTLAILLWPARRTPPALAPAAEGVVIAPGVPRLVGQRLRVVPPAYTGLPPRDLDSLDARAPQGSRLSWTLAFAPRPAAPALAFLDGRRVPLSPGADDRWSADLPLDRSALYRVAPGGAAPSARLHRLDAVIDRAPTVVALTPARGLTAATPGQRRWALLFAAGDDYGVQPTALLHLTLATGEGEQLKFTERTVTVPGSGPPRARRFAVALDLAALGFTGPGDLVAQLEVADNRTPGPQHVRSPSLILRRALPEAAGAPGLDGMLRAALPTALRSQRQVVNDAEALVLARGTLPPARFLLRAQSIGGDQQALRDRYGGMIGQETGGGAPSLPTSDAPAAGPVGRMADVTAEFGEEKEDPEADTFYDRGTRARLQAMIDQMWRSETALKGGDPAAALPFANRALVLLKEAQRAERIYLAHVSAGELPPIDEGRRLTGKRDGLGPDPLLLPPRQGDERAATAAWAEVDGLPGRTPLAGAHTPPPASADPLALAAARDEVRRDPGCVPCRMRLRALTWGATPRPPAGVTRREAVDGAGRRYLQALGGGR